MRINLRWLSANRSPHNLAIAGEHTGCDISDRIAVDAYEQLLAAVPGDRVSLTVFSEDRGRKFLRHAPGCICAPGSVELAQCPATHELTHVAWQPLEAVVAAIEFSAEGA